MIDFSDIGFVGGLVPPTAIMGISLTSNTGLVHGGEKLTTGMTITNSGTAALEITSVDIHMPNYTGGYVCMNYNGVDGTQYAANGDYTYNLSPSLSIPAGGNTTVLQFVRYKLSAASFSGTFAINSNKTSGANTVNFSNSSVSL